MASKYRSCRLLLLALTVSSVVCGGTVHARGGFAGFHGGGGGFREDRGFHDDYGYRGGRGFDGFREEGMRSDAFQDFDRGFDHPHDEGRIDSGGLDMHPDAAWGPHDYGRGNPADNGVRNYDQHNLTSDSGFENFSRPVAAALPHGYQTWRVTPENLAHVGYGVRNGFNNYGAFRHDWWANHPYAWRRNWWNDYWPWQWATWGGLAGFWGIGASNIPVYYDYGDNITYDNSGNVDYGNESVCSGADYYQQAVDLASAGQTDDFGESASGQTASPPPPSGSAKSVVVSKTPASTTRGDWQPFGVYSLVQGGQTSSSMLFQLCTNKKGQIRGNYFNTLTDEVEPVKGSIDKKRMRACWTVGKDSKVVYDTGVANLLKGESPILIHYGKDTTQQWTLVRIKNTQSSK